MRRINKITTLVLSSIGALSIMIEASAQTIEWVAREGRGNFSAPCNGCLVVDSEGNVALAARDDARSTLVFEYLTMKYNPQGSVMWRASYTTQEGGGEPQDIAVDPDGNIYVTGNSSQKMATLKYGPTGGRLWASRYPAADTFRADARAMAVDLSGNVYVTGYSVTGQTLRATTVKYDSVGSERWATHYTDASIAAGSRIALNSLGEPIILGVVGDNVAADYLIVKYDTNGSQRWARQLDVTARATPAAIVVDAAGNTYGAGSSSDGASVGVGDLFSYDASGLLRWRETYQSSGSGVDSLTALELDSFGNLYVAGNTGPVRSDFLAMKYTGDGSRVWIRSYDGPPGGLSDELADLAVDAAGNAFVTGRSIGAGTREDYATVKWDRAGNMRWVARYTYDEDARDFPAAIEVDSGGNVYVTGTRNGPPFDTIKYSQPTPPDCNSNGINDELDVFIGTSTDCNTNSIPDECEKIACVGACCLGDGTCMVLREALCRLFSGSRWAGPDTTCVNVDGAVRCPLGACCLPDGLCAADRTEASCAADGGTFRGFTTTCQGANCPQPSGACCLVSGGCLSLSRADCNVFPGATWAGALTTCVDVGGTPRCPLGACCLADGTCREGQLPAACQGLGGTHRPGGVTCAQAACPQPSGACCLSSGSCLSATQVECGLFGGATWAGALTACADLQGTPTCPLGACCLPDGRCVGGILSAACTAQAGTFRGPGSGCANANCPQPTGACCLANGSCIVLLRADCQAAPNNRWAGPNTTCVDGNANGRADACESVPGDINGDGAANPSDISPFVAAILGTPQAPEHVARADVNADGVVDGRDVAAMVAVMVSG